MYPPNDRATCALIKILWEFEHPTWVNERYEASRPAHWARTPEQEFIRALSARMAP